MKAEIFEKHSAIRNFYNTDYAMINEYFVRAFQIRFMELHRALFPSFDIGKEYEYQRETFQFIDRFVEALRQFEETEVDFSEFYTERIEEILS